MFPKYEMKRLTTIETMEKIIRTEPDRISLLVRHSERHFHESAKYEPFMGLTENGKTEAVKFGSSLTHTPYPKLFSSYIGRCIETAYLIDKGYFQKYGQTNNNTHLSFDLAPFYIQNIEKAVSMVSETGSDIFLRSWFNKEISEDIMLNPEEASQQIVQFMKQELQKLDKDEIGIFVSHDWNLFPINEFFLGLKHEEYGAVGYLDSVFLFEKDDNFYLASHQKNAVMI
jgi:hypothetical protein